MLHNAINAIRDEIALLGYIEKITGVVQKVIQYDESEQAEALGLKVVKSAYPVSSQVTARDCWERGRYTDLVPDSRKKAICYFEPQSSIGINTDGNTIYFKQSFRCVVWLNLQLLGVANEYVTETVILDINKAINETKFFQFNGSTLGLQAQTTGIIHREPSIFSEYTYNNETMQNVMYPFDYFAIDFNLLVIAGESCFPKFTPLAPITCQII
jgi:hypothetical protein